jgi:queuosine precursor transporter
VPALPVIALVVAYVATIPLANWMVQNVGTVCVANGPCLLPVWPGILAPSGVALAGLALVLRDLVQRRAGLVWSLAAIGVGVAVSALLAPPALVAGSAMAFLVSELADAAVYTPLQRRGLLVAVLASSAVGAVVDSVVFLRLAFGSLDHVEGQIIGKLWAVAAAVALIGLMRRGVRAGGDRDGLAA